MVLARSTSWKNHGYGHVTNKWNWLRIRCDGTSSGCSDAMSRHISAAPLGLHTRCGFVKRMDSCAMGSKGRGTLNSWKNAVYVDANTAAGRLKYDCRYVSFSKRLPHRPPSID